MRILCVEDEVKLANSLARGLKAEGYVVDNAYASDQALLMSQSNEYDLVLLDWMIPGPTDGPGLVSKWRQNGLHMPVLMLTARGSIGDRVEGLDAGADDYLAKPFAFDELLARIRALLRRPNQTGGSDMLTAGPITLDIRRKLATVDAAEIQLTAKEYQLLEALIRHAGEVMSKERLLVNVWSDEDRVQHNTVETFIGHLRRKLQPNDNLLKTVRGHGYMIETR